MRKTQTWNGSDFLLGNIQGSLGLALSFVGHSINIVLTF